MPCAHHWTGPVRARRKRPAEPARRRGRRAGSCAQQRRAVPRATVRRARPDAAERPARAPTLYGTLCGSGDSTACTAPTAPQAEFRTASGTWPRVGGLLLIAAGTLGMLLLLGFLALRLLGAALATLAVPAARAARGARPGARGRRARRLSAVADPARRRDAREARLLGRARRGAARRGLAQLARQARLVDAVAADLRLLVDGVRATPSAAFARPARARRACAPHTARDARAARRARLRRGLGSRSSIDAHDVLGGPVGARGGAALARAFTGRRCRDPWPSGLRWESAGRSAGCAPRAACGSKT